jgi:hypothetical protein
MGARNEGSLDNFYYSTSEGTHCLYGWQSGWNPLARYWNPNSVKGFLSGKTLNVPGLT